MLKKTALFLRLGFPYRQFDYAHVGILILQILQILQILILILQKKIVGILILDITFDRVLAFDLIESERSPPKFFTAPANRVLSARVLTI